MTPIKQQVGGLMGWHSSKGANRVECQHSVIHSFSIHGAPVRSPVLEASLLEQLRVSGEGDKPVSRTCLAPSCIPQVGTVPT